MRGKTRIFYEKEKIKMEENMEMETVKDEDSEVIDYDNPCNSEKRGVLPLVGVALLVGAGAIGTFIYKNRAKLEERRINKLRKKGYIITKAEVNDYDYDDSDSEENED